MYPTREELNAFYLAEKLRNAKLVAALESIAGWRNAKINGYMFSDDLVGIIESIIDCADAALQQSTEKP